MSHRTMWAWLVVATILAPPAAHAQDGATALAEGQRRWRRLETTSALAAFERATADPRTAAEAWLAIGRIRAFRGWQAEGAFPGWHEEVDQRPLALEAFRKASTLRPAWAEPQVALGEALRLDGRVAEAVAAFDRALALAPGDEAAARGRQRAAGMAVADAEAEALAALAAAAKAGQAAEAIRQVRAFAARWPSSPRLVDACDIRLAVVQTRNETSAADIDEAIDARIAARPDPFAYGGAVNVLLARRVRLDRVPALADQGLAAADRFVTENEPSYKLRGKVQAFRDRLRAGFADQVGWAAFLQNDRATADQKLEEAARLSNGTDFVNQFHRAELARARGDVELARERYYEALSLESAPPVAPLRAAAEAALAGLYAAEGITAADTEANIGRELERRRAERRRALVSSAIGRTLPALPVTDLSGTPVGLAGRTGQVTLLNFFAAWCGACRQEIPVIQQAWERYKTDPGVRFVLISLDDDPARLERYMAERKFGMPVLRMTRDEAAAALDVQDTPWTFYVDSDGTIRYEVRGLEPHGDGLARISWYIDQLAGRSR